MRELAKLAQTFAVAGVGRISFREFIHKLAGLEVDSVYNFPDPVQQTVAVSVDCHCWHWSLPIRQIFVPLFERNDFSITTTNNAANVSGW